MQVEGSGLVLIMDMCVTPFRWEEAKERTISGICLCGAIPLALEDAWLTAAQLWQDPTEESRAPVLPQAA